MSLPLSGGATSCSPSPPARSKRRNSDVRMSNTEPVARLNVETRGDALLMKQKTDEVLAVLRSTRAGAG